MVGPIFELQPTNFVRIRISLSCKMLNFCCNISNGIGFTKIRVECCPYLETSLVYLTSYYPRHQFWQGSIQKLRGPRRGEGGVKRIRKLSTQFLNARQPTLVGIFVLDNLENATSNSKTLVVPETQFWQLKDCIEAGNTQWGY